MSETEILYLPTPDRESLSEFTEEFLSGEIVDAIVIYRKDGEEQGRYRILTKSPYSSIGWLLFQTTMSVAVDQGDIEDD